MLFNNKGDFRLNNQSIDNWVLSLQTINIPLSQFRIICPRFVLVSLMSIPWRRYPFTYLIESNGTNILLREFTSEVAENYERKRQGHHFEYHCVQNPDLEENRVLMNLITGSGISILYNTAPDCAIINNNVENKTNNKEDCNYHLSDIKSDSIQLWLRDPKETDSNVKYIELKKFVPGYLHQFDKLLSTWAQAVLGNISTVVIGTVGQNKVTVGQIDEYSLQDLEAHIKKLKPYWSAEKSWNSLSQVCSKIQECIGSNIGFYMLKYLGHGSMELLKVDGVINVVTVLQSNV